MQDKIITTLTTIPAMPGWYVAYVVEGKADKCERHFALDPIIAWEIEREELIDPQVKYELGETRVRHSVGPLTRYGSPNYFRNSFMIKTPDGRFEDPGDVTYSTEAEALAAINWNSSGAPEHGGTRAEPTP